MRKWFWCCAAAGVVAAGSFGAVKYSGRHPERMPAVAVTSACKIGLDTMPFTACTARQPVPKPACRVPLPSTVKTAAWPRCRSSRLNCRAIPCRLPRPSSSVNDEDLKELSLADPVTTDNGNVFGGYAVGIECVEMPAGHKTMPYADEPEHHAAMPYAEEDAALNSTAGNLFGLGINGPYEVVLEEQTTPELSLWRRFVRAIQGMGETAGATEESEPKEHPAAEGKSFTQSYYPHDHYEVCPYSGHPAVGRIARAWCRSRRRRSSRRRAVRKKARRSSPRKLARPRFASSTTIGNCSSRVRPFRASTRWSFGRAITSSTSTSSSPARCNINSTKPSTHGCRSGPRPGRFHAFCLPDIGEPAA